MTPLKQITMPRMELTAALLSARISKYLHDELKYPIIEHFFWVDSKIVLGYINNEAKRFQIYVANRIQQIRDLTSPSSWFYVDSKTNPSDEASRGIEARKFVCNSKWLVGPEFLWQSSNLWTNVPYAMDAETNEEVQREMRKATVLATTTDENSSIESSGMFGSNWVNRFSSWFRVKRVVAYCLLFRNKMKAITLKTNSIVSERMSVNLLREAEREIVKSVQRESYGEELCLLAKVKDGTGVDTDQLGNQAALKKSSPIYRLDPYLDDGGVIRVGGRIDRAELSEEVKHPIIMPRKSHITELIIRYCHEKVNHIGKNSTPCEIRERGFWIAGGSSAVTYYISRCVVCKRIRGSLQTQKMADLPKEKLREEPPFTYTGVDLLGPFYIKEKRSILKRYGVIWTCLSSRAIHLEKVNSLDTDSFINAMRRFLARRGSIRQLHSDCGSNIVGAKNELHRAKKEMNEQVIRNYLLDQECDLIEHKFNVPHSSHMGGSWERQIRLVRSVLLPMLMKNGSQLDDESLQTFLAEAENVVNSRPLTCEDLCDDTTMPLSPNNLLTLKPKLLLPPPGRFQRLDLYVRQRWRRVQHLSNEFWLKWRKQLLHQLQHRQKWVTRKRNLQVGDVVILAEEDTPRNSWKLARVEIVYPGPDELVRKVQLRLADTNMNCKGERAKPASYIDRPIHKLVLLHPAPEDESNNNMKIVN